MALAIFFAGCSDTPNIGSTSDRELLTSRAAAALADFKNADPTLQRLLDHCLAYAIFPEVVNGAAVFGGAHGDGEVYGKGKLIGYADVSLGSVGAQLGGQKYAELILFQHEGSLLSFQARDAGVRCPGGRHSLRHPSGAAAAANYSRGVIVFTLPESGLMGGGAAAGLQKAFVVCAGTT